LRAGLLNLPSYFREHPRFATGLALEERAKVNLHDTPDAVLVWALLEPLVEQLFQPFLLRGPQTGLKSREEQLAAWAAVDALVAILGLNVSDELAVLRYGGGWHRLRAAEQVAAKQRLLAAFARQLTADAISRYRAASVTTLLDQYYAKAAKRAPTRRQVLANRALQRLLAAYFGGDWLALLAYIGEPPHPDERIASALPEPRLQVGGVARAEAVAAELGVPAAEVERMLAAYWDRPTGVSPIEERVQVVQRYWQVLDEVHARQAPGMRPLWGLVEDIGTFTLADGNFDTIPYHDGLYRELLPDDLLREIDRLWGTVMLPRWPERMVSAQTPHLGLAETLGPALKFWHGCGLTAWFICEGPSSRTDIAGMPQYYREELAQLADLGCPVDGALFTDLLHAERRLGPPEPIPERSSTTEVVPGIAITLTINHGQRRRGFEELRDVVTRHRRAWTAASFERYLRARWEEELRAVGREYNRLMEEKGKPPTPRQFAGRAVAVTNHWFGGDLAALYGALGEKTPLQPERVALMPADRAAFAWSVFRALGGTPFRRERVVASREAADEQNERGEVYNTLKRLAELSLWYVQLKEALGRPPELKDFGRGKFEWAATTLAGDIETAWTRYQEAVKVALRGTHVRQTPRASTPPIQERPAQSVLTSATQAAAPSVPQQPPPPPAQVLDRPDVPSAAQPASPAEPERGRPWWKRVLGR
jgi:hypothetical protein